ncbi:MAG: pyridoxal phosphate-dependent aminotransferase [SAR324 cluster bacterium]|nr:pyridoxal phosphate-dependent aminotransferase [SAR324 cluster bacterium]
MNNVISDAMRESLERSSWIRRMFEEGAKLKAEHGPENVFDFSLGNPILEPPPGFYAALRELIGNPQPGMHRYIPNAGVPEVREFMGEELRRQTGLDYAGRHVVMTCGAAGGVNVVLKALLNPGEELVTFCPYFVEYDFYASNHGGKLVRAETDEAFQIDLEALEKVVTPRTRALIINSPNNPTGAVYPAERLRALAGFLEQAAERHGRPIFLICDEPYRRLAFDGVEIPWVPPLYAHTILVTSFSKDLSLAGERVGFVAVSPRAEGWEELMEAMILANRILGFVNAPALMQRVLPLLKDALADVDYYQRMRDQLVPPLVKMGYEVINPSGSFFVFPKSPIPDDVAFVRAAQKKRLLIVPGSGFGRGGYFRISLSVTPEVIDRALPVFEELLREVRETE